MKTVWFHGMTDEEKEAFEQLLRNSTKVCKRIREVLESRKLALEREELDVNSVDDVVKVASMNGRRRELRDIISLFDFLKP